MGKIKMSNSAWLKDGDEVITKQSFEYFNDLIDYVDSKGLREDFRKWVNNK